MNNPAYLLSLRQQYGNVSAEKLTQIAQMMQDFSAAQSEVMGARGSMPPADLNQKMQALQKDRDAAITRLLSPEEYEDYLLRSSPTAITLRNQLQAFNATEAEYKAIFQLQKEFDDRYTGQPMTPDLARSRAQAQVDLRQQIVAALGPERGNDYTLSLEPGSAQLTKMVNRLQLPTSSVAELLAVQKEIQAKAQAASRGAAPADRETAIAALRAEASARIGGIVGASGLEVYKQYGGSWLSSPTLSGQAAPVAAPRGGGALNIAQ